MIDINWTDLREQKLSLLKVIERTEYKEANDLQALVCMIDALQDDAVGRGVDEREVFGD